MTSQLLTRLPTALKKEFEAKAAEKGLSMNFLITAFVESYTKNPTWIQVYVDDDMVDEILRKSLSSPQAKKASVSLHKAIKAAWL